MPLGQSQDIPQTDPRGMATPRFWHRLIRFRHFCSGSLALASPNHTCRNLVPTFPQRSPPWLLTTAACGGLRSTPDCRPRRTCLHLSYSYASPFGPALLVTQDPYRNSGRLNERGNANLFLIYNLRRREPRRSVWRKRCASLRPDPGRPDHLAAFFSIVSYELDELPAARPLHNVEPGPGDPPRRHRESSGRTPRLETGPRRRRRRGRERSALASSEMCRGGRFGIQRQTRGPMPEWSHRLSRNPSAPARRPCAPRRP